MSSGSRGGPRRAPGRQTGGRSRRAGARPDDPRNAVGWTRSRRASCAGNSCRPIAEAAGTWRSACRPASRYRVGDHLGVCPKNDEEQVERLARHLGAALDGLLHGAEDDERPRRAEGRRAAGPQRAHQPRRHHRQADRAAARPAARQGGRPRRAVEAGGDQGRPAGAGRSRFAAARGDRRGRLRRARGCSTSSRPAR